MPVPMLTANHDGVKLRTILRHPTSSLILGGIGDDGGGAAAAAAAPSGMFRCCHRSLLSMLSCLGEGVVAMFQNPLLLV